MGARVLSAGVLGVVGVLLGAQAGLAQQIVPDGTLGAESSRVTLNFQGLVGVDGIEGGARRGNNLFHSFEGFGIALGRSGYFVVDDLAIQNILARVTGNQRSEILGRVGTRAFIDGNFSRSPANLFLINPNGIIFGPNARLDVGASFAATTASGVRFGGQGVFSTEQRDAPPLLTVQPDAFLFTRLTPAGIEMRASAPTFGGWNGFRVNNGQRLLLLGGDVTVDGGGLIALGGRVDVGAVAAPGTVVLQGDGELGFADGLERGTVRFERGTFVRVDNIGGGDIGVTARDIEVSGGSQLRGGIFPGLGTPASQAGTVRLVATGTLTVASLSLVDNGVNSGATGRGGNVEIETGSLVVRDGAQLSTGTFGKGDAGNVLITAGDRVLFQGANGQFTSAAFSNVGVGGEGRGGNVVIAAPILEVLDGAQLASATRGKGEAGNVQITAGDRVLFQGVNGSFPSAAFSSLEAGGEGKGGNVVITVPVLEVRDGAKLIANTRGKGDAGNILITVGDRVLFENGFAFSNVAAGGVGKGGNVVIATPVLEVRDGAQLSASTFGKGDAGNVQITAGDRVLFQGANGQFPSAAFSNVEIGGEGKGGNVVITVPVLEVRDGAKLVANTRGKGDAGNILITAGDRVLFQNGFALSSVDAGGEGKGGNVVIAAPVLEVLDGALLSASTFGTGNAGNVQITAGARVLFQGANTTAFSNVEAGGEGKGGNVVITTPMLEVLDGAQLIASTDGKGDAGNVVITAGDRVLFQGRGQNASAAFSRVDASGEGKGGNLVITTPVLEVLDGALLSASTFGKGNAGNVQITASDRVLFQNSYVFSSVEAGAVGRGGNVEINADSVEVRDGTLITASSVGQGNAGDIKVSANKELIISNGGTVTSNIGTSQGDSVFGNAGSITLEANNITLDQGGQIQSGFYRNSQGQSSFVSLLARDSISIRGKNGRFNSGIFTNAETGSVANGSDVFLMAPIIRIEDSGVVFADNNGQGNGGTIRLNGRDISLANGSTLTTSLGTTGRGRSGNIEVFATTFTVAGESSLVTQTLGNGPAGNIKIDADRAVILDQGSLLISSVGNSPAGNLNLTTPRLLLSNGSRIDADSNTSNGGNITLTLSDSLVMRNGSLISATAGRAQGAGDGGNITINSPFVLSIPQENNDIIANAFSGTGGNITINADAILNFTLNDKGKTFDQLRNQPTNDISASSEFGGNGTLNLAGLNVDPSRGSVQLPIVPTDNTDRIDTYCAPKSNTTARTSFVTSGRGGLPSRPGNQANTFNTGDIRDFSPDLAQQSPPNPKPEQPLTEAQLSRTTPDGKTHLLAGRAIITPTPNCPEPKLSSNKSSL